MRKRILVFAVLVLLLCAGAGGFAAEKSVMTSFNKPGHLNVYAGAGLYPGGFNVTGGAEYIISDFQLGSAPFAWGLMAQAILGFANSSNLDWGVAPLASLHLGTNFGGLAKFDFFISAGLGIYSGGLGFASYDGVTWMFSSNVGLLLEYGFVGWTSTGAIGVILKL
jgi:hypothetical protein